MWVSQEDRHILTFQRLPYLLLNLLLVVYIYIIICFVHRILSFAVGFESMSVFVFGGTSTHNAPPKCKEYFNRCWFFSPPLDFSLFSSRVKHRAYFPSENRPSFKTPYLLPCLQRFRSVWRLRPMLWFRDAGGSIWPRQFLSEHPNPYPRENPWKWIQLQLVEVCEGTGRPI